MKRTSAALWVALGLAGCAETTIDEVDCPPEGTTLTYESFGRSFIDDNCQSCHGATSSGRKGAPSGYDFGSADEVRRWRSRIFSRAALDNTTMPPGPDVPPRDERDKLAEWLACGAP
jgi:uncharacterized membrane protein